MRFALISPPPPARYESPSQPCPAAAPPAAPVVQAMIRVADKDESGDVDLTEFYVCMRKTGAY